MARWPRPPATSPSTCAGRSSHWRPRCCGWSRPRRSCTPHWPPRIPTTTSPPRPRAARTGARDARGTRLVRAHLHAEIRVSLLGNHYVRFEGVLGAAGPQGVYSALWRAAPEHGTVDVRLGDSAQQWPRLSALAMDLVADLSGRL